MVYFPQVQIQPIDEPLATAEIFPIQKFTIPTLQLASYIPKNLTRGTFRRNFILVSYLYCTRTSIPSLVHVQEHLSMAHNILDPFMQYPVQRIYDHLFRRAMQTRPTFLAQDAYYQLLQLKPFTIEYVALILVLAATIAGKNDFLRNGALGSSKVTFKCSLEKIITLVPNPSNVTMVALYRTSYSSPA